MTRIMDSADFVEALMDLDNNPDFGVRVDQSVYGHYVDGRGMVYADDGQQVGIIPDDVLAYRTSAARDFG